MARSDSQILIESPHDRVRWSLHRMLCLEVNRQEKSISMVVEPREFSLQILLRPTVEPKAQRSVSWDGDHTSLGGSAGSDVLPFTLLAISGWLSKLDVSTPKWQDIPKLPVSLIYQLYQGVSKDYHKPLFSRSLVKQYVLWIIPCHRDMTWRVIEKKSEVGKSLWWWSDLAKTSLASSALAKNFCVWMMYRRTRWLEKSQDGSFGILWISHFFFGKYLKGGNAFMWFYLKHLSNLAQIYRLHSELLG